MGLLESLQLNQARGTGAARLFETGRVFLEINGVVNECVAVGFVINETDSRRSWLKREAPDFYIAKNYVSILAADAGIDLSRQDAIPVDGAFYGWQEGHSAAGGEMKNGYLARFGLMNLAMIKSLGIEGKVWAGVFAIVPEKLSANSMRRRYQLFSLMPAVLRDLALVVDAATPAGEVRKALTKIVRAAVANAFTLETVEGFDVYQGQGLPEGRKSPESCLA